MSCPCGAVRDANSSSLMHHWFEYRVQPSPRRPPQSSAAVSLLALGIAAAFRHLVGVSFRQVVRQDLDLPPRLPQRARGAQQLGEHDGSLFRLIAAIDGVDKEL
eukprot:3742432-Prymnesium_polylepis.1